MKIIRTSLVSFGCFLFLLAAVAFAEVKSDDGQSDSGDEKSQSRSSKTPDVRGSEMKVKLEKGHFIAVPIPQHNPQLDWGLVLGAAYFHKQTEEQKKAQPASVSGIAAYYSQNGSWALGLGQESYWDEDNWRFTGVLGAADLDLTLLVPDAGSDDGIGADWLLVGEFLAAQIQRKIAKQWYLGVMGRYVDFDQSIALGLQPVDLGLVFSSESKAVGLGISLERDSRDMPTNPYNGSLFKVSGLFNDESFGSDSTYESYNVAYNSYHKLTAPVVLAWQVKACQKTGTPPLWDACRVGLRGFSAMDYMGKESALAQVEARWQMSKRWGAVVFAGAGYMNDSVSGIRDQEAIPSYGAGIRFMVMTAKRINLRIDYGRSKDSSAWYLSAGEAF
jgi:hypothetical protein